MFYNAHILFRLQLPIRLDTRFNSSRSGRSIVFATAMIHSLPVAMFAQSKKLYRIVCVHTASRSTSSKNNTLNKNRFSFTCRGPQHHCSLPLCPPSEAVWFLCCVSCCFMLRVVLSIMLNILFTLSSLFMPSPFALFSGSFCDDPAPLLLKKRIETR
jgi:hypothetical protein